jgi:AcrR family transcriptional regulator
MTNSPAQRLADAAAPPEARRRLIDSAVAAFAQRGYHATTTRQISEQAGMSPAALYVHFRSKEDVLFAISLEGHQGALRAVRDAEQTSADPTEQLRAVVRAFTAWHAREHTIARTVQHELAALSPDHLAEIAEVRREIEGTVRAILERGAVAGVFDVPDIAGAGLAILSLGIDVARWFDPDGGRSADELGELYGDLAVRMVRAQLAGGQSR